MESNDHRGMEPLHALALQEQKLLSHSIPDNNTMTNLE